MNNLYIGPPMIQAIEPNKYYEGKLIKKFYNAAKVTMHQTKWEDITAYYQKNKKEIDR